MGITATTGSPGTWFPVGPVVLSHLGRSAADLPPVRLDSRAQKLPCRPRQRHFCSPGAGPSRICSNMKAAGQFTRFLYGRGNAPVCQRGADDVLSPPVPSISTGAHRSGCRRSAGQSSFRVHPADQAASCVAIRTLNLRVKIYKNCINNLVKQRRS